MSPITNTDIDLRAASRSINAEIDLRAASRNINADGTFHTPPTFSPTLAAFSIHFSHIFRCCSLYYYHMPTQDEFVRDAIKIASLLDTTELADAHIVPLHVRVIGSLQFSKFTMFATRRMRNGS